MHSCTEPVLCVRGIFLRWTALAPQSFNKICIRQEWQYEQSLLPSKKHPRSVNLVLHLFIHFGILLHGWVYCDRGLGWCAKSLCSWVLLQLLCLGVVHPLYGIREKVQLLERWLVCFRQRLGDTYGCVWKWLVPLNPMVLLITIPMKNGYFIGNINPTFSDKPISQILGCHIWVQPNPAEKRCLFERPRWKLKILSWFFKTEFQVGWWKLYIYI